VEDIERVADRLAAEAGADGQEAQDAVPQPTDREVRLAVLLAEMARDMSSEDSVEDTLNTLVRRAVDAVSGCRAAGITVSRRGWYETPAATEQLVHDVDRLQYETDEGPCLDALNEHEIFRTGDLGADPRWPRFGTGAAELGVRSMLSFRLFVEDETLGSLNLYSAAADAFGDRSVAVGALFAAHAALAFDQAKSKDSARNLERALDGNRRVGMAIGILMAHHRLDEHDAFDALRVASQRLNRKLREIAEDVIRTGELPH
jgi:GAF domain-containing protein